MPGQVKGVRSVGVEYPGAVEIGHGDQPVRGDGNVFGNPQAAIAGGAVAGIEQGIVELECERAVVVEYLDGVRHVKRGNLARRADGDSGGLEVVKAPVRRSKLECDRPRAGGGGGRRRQGRSRVDGNVSRGAERAGGAGGGQHCIRVVAGRVAYGTAVEGQGVHTRIV